MIHAVIDEALMSKELFDLLRVGVSDALSIATYDEPATEEPTVKYSDEVRRRFDEANAPHIKEQPDA
jgi:hypothetical protein